jgi:urease accessory protein
MNFMPVRQYNLPIAPPLAQRAKGRLALAFRHDEAASRTRIEKFYQEGCLKARLPHPASAEIAEAITINISGGIASGDSLATDIEIGAGAAVSITSQAAERIYRALDFLPARLQTTITLGAGAMLDYLPQETILFDGFALDRSLVIELAQDADFLGVESIVFGRQAMGETVQFGALNDSISLRRNGTLVLQDMTRLHGDIAVQLSRKAVAAGNIAMASIIYAGPDLDARLQAIRACLGDTQCEAGASAFEGIVFTRILAPSAAALRAGVVAVLKICRDNRALPRSWQS